MPMNGDDDKDRLWEIVSGALLLVVLLAILTSNLLESTALLSTIR